MTKTTTFGSLAVGAKFKFLTQVDGRKLDATCSQVTGANFSFVARTGANEPVEVEVDDPRFCEE